MLLKRYVRDDSRRIIGSITAGYSHTTAVVRVGHNRITGRSNERFQTTRDAHKLVTNNSSDPDLLIGRKK